MRRLIPITLLCSVAIASIHAQPAPSRPNIVLIITDDVGYGDIGSYGAPDIKTPHIDGLATAGARLTHFYANGPTCTPTRAGLITGRYQQRLIPELERPLGSAATDTTAGLAATGRSLPQMLRDNGYATGLIGKWHLGWLPEFSPRAHGFDTFFGFKSGYVDYYQHTDGDGRPDLFEGDQPVTVAGYMTDLITERSVKFIGDHARSPFFLEVAYNAAHWPYQVPDQPSTAINNGRHVLAHDEKPDTRADYVRIMERADAGVGQILAALERHGLSSDTLVIFTNDNGGEWLSNNAPLFHRKSTVYEGGIRVPTILRWPGRIPAGLTSDQVGITMDLTATILAVSGTAVPADAKLEGINLVPLLAKGASPVTRTLFWRATGAGLNQRAVREGNWKLVVDGALREMLFDVSADPGERNDLVAQNPAVVRRLYQALQAWEKQVDAEAKSLAGGSAKPVPERK